MMLISYDYVWLLHFVYSCCMLCLCVWIWICLFFDCVFFFFFKQKTAYEMRISDWSSDVCSSDLFRPAYARHRRCRGAASARPRLARRRSGGRHDQIGRASCRERVCQYV